MLLSEERPYLRLHIPDSADELVRDLDRCVRKHHVKRPHVTDISDWYLERYRPASGCDQPTVGVDHSELASVAEASGSRIEARAEGQTDGSGMRRQVLKRHASGRVAFNTPD